MRISRILAGLGAALVLTMGVSVAAAAPVLAAAPRPNHSLVAMIPAAGVNPLSCQAPNAQAVLFLASGNIWGYDCTGTYYPNVNAIRFDAGGWSGYIHWNGQTRKFCDWHTLLGSGIVTEIDFSPTKLPGC